MPDERRKTPLSGRRVGLLKMGAAIAALLIAVGMALDASSRHTPSRAEQTIEYRRAIFQLMRFNLRPLRAMAEGKSPYIAEEFALRAQRVNDMSHLLAEAYPPELLYGAATRAKAANCKNRQAFDTRLEALQATSSSVVAAASRGTFDETKLAFFEMAGACRDCHDEHRAD